MFLTGDIKTDNGQTLGSIRRVLVVDDSRLQRRILVSLLKKWGFEIYEADSGESALIVCAESMPDLVLSDWMMPGMTGLEFCQEFRKLPRDGYGYFILLTSKSEKNDVALGLDAGADDFLTKPVSSDELRARITAGDRIFGMQQELSKKNRLISDTLIQLQAAYDTIDKDLIQAKKVQESLVPDRSRNFDGGRVSLLLKPCGHIGGDLVGMFSPCLDQVGFYSIDVSGHGITSAMMTARLGGYLSSTYFDQNLGMQMKADGGHRLRQPDEVAQILNARLLEDTGIEEYFTMAYVTADLRSGRVDILQAGHPHPLVLRRNGRAEFVGQGGIPIGLLPDVHYEQFEAVLKPGDRLLLYSDGFTECQMKNGEMLEQAGLVELIQECRADQPGQEFLDELFGELTQRMSPVNGRDDDVSAILFEYYGQGESQNPS